MHVPLAIEAASQAVQVPIPVFGSHLLFKIVQFRPVHSVGSGGLPGTGGAVKLANGSEMGSEGSCQEPVDPG